MSKALFSWSLRNIKRDTLKIIQRTAIQADSIESL